MDAGTNDLRVKDLKVILDKLPDDMLVIIPVVDEDDVNEIFGFRKVRTVGILESMHEQESDRKVLCLNGATAGADIADQIDMSDLEVSALTVLYGYSKYDGPVEESVK